MEQFWKHNPQALFKKGIVGGNGRPTMFMLTTLFVSIFFPSQYIFGLFSHVPFLGTFIAFAAFAFYFWLFLVYISYILGSWKQMYVNTAQQCSLSVQCCFWNSWFYNRKYLKV